MVSRRLIVGLLLAVVFAAPSWASSEAPVATSPSPSHGTGVSTPWGYLDVSLSDGPTDLPFRLRLAPGAEFSWATTSSALIPYVAVGRAKKLDSELPDGIRNLTQNEVAPLQTAAGLSWLLQPNVEISGEYQFAGLSRSSLTLDPSALGRSLIQDLASLGFSLNLSIRY